MPVYNKMTRNNGNQLLVIIVIASFLLAEGSSQFDAVNQLSQSLSDIANGMVPKISRGVYVKSSHYNQGTTDNMVLIEVGAQSNTKEEVQATVDVIARTIGEYLG